MIQPVGYIKLHRELSTKPIWFNSTSKQKVILITLLMMANFRENEWDWNGKRFKLEPGQFVTSLNSIAKEAGNDISIKNVRTALDRFESLDFLASKSTNKNRLITITNWELYQVNDEQLADKVASKRQANGKQTATKEEGKESKKVKNEIDIVVLNEFFETIWTRYPRKEGKGSVSATQKKALYKLGIDVVTKCIERYEKEKSGKDKQFLQMGSTFFNSGYIDYLDENYKMIENQIDLKKISEGVFKL